MKIIQPLLLLPVLAAMLLLPGPLLAEEPVDLRIKWTPGERQIRENSVVLMQDLETPGQGQMKQEMKMLQRMAVGAAETQPEGGVRVIELEFQAIKADTKMGPIDMSYDSDNPDANNPMAAGFAGMIGRKIRLHLDQDGRFVKAEGLEAVAGKEAAGAAIPFATEEGLAQMMKMGTMALPDKPVRPGDQWTREIQMPLAGMGSVQINLDSVFDKWEEREGRRTALINFTGVLSMKATQEGGPLGMSMSMENGRMEGRYWFDPELGATVATEMTQTSNISMTMNPPGGQGPMDIKTDMNTTIRERLVSVEKTP